MITVKPYTGDNLQILQTQKELHEYMKRMKDVYPLDFRDPVVYNNEILAEGERSLKNQQKRLSLLPSFKDEIVLDIECDTGFLCYEIAKTANYCIGVSTKGSKVIIPKYILAKDNNISNVEFHDLYNIGWIRKNNNRCADTILCFYMKNISEVSKIFLKLWDLCSKRILVEPVIDNNSKNNNVESIIAFLDNFGETTFLGYSEYENRGLFQINKVSDKKNIVRNKEKDLHDLTIKELIYEMYKNQLTILHHLTGEDKK
ncbi:MAG: hypothetical protein JXJ04_10420 [Spirochaetales bacterium]|nr:hypothetical protein [Spirochaetales bacterium]